MSKQRWSLDRIGLGLSKNGISNRLQLLAFIPAASLGVFWIGGETALLATAIAVPLILAMRGQLATPAPPRAAAVDPVTGLHWRDIATDTLTARMIESQSTRSRTACVVISIDDAASLAVRLPPNIWESALERIATRLRTEIRDDDAVARIGCAEFALTIQTQGRATRQLLISIVGRIQDVLSDAIPVADNRLMVTASAGLFIASEGSESSGALAISRAEMAFVEARDSGPGQLKFFDCAAQDAPKANSWQRDEFIDALDNGEIHAWFQPQIDMTSHKICGTETLVRWLHPDHGLIAPDEFLPMVERSGLSDRLGKHMLDAALSALTTWDGMGLEVPEISVNFSEAELGDTGLIERIRDALIAHDIAPERLRIEVLETVIASGQDDPVVQNLWRLTELGCLIDLDDFGTGHAAISNIRRFSIGRLKIDRSFVTLVDRDEDQQDTVAAIMVMAEKMGLDVIAEGVENTREIKML